MTGRAGERPLTIVFAVWSGAGHINSSLTLARPLRERGHRVIYFGLAPGRPLVAGEGFEFVAFAEDLAPEDAQLGGDRPGPWWQRMAEQRRVFRAFVERCSDGTIDRQLQSIRPDVAVCDSLMWYVAMRVRALGLPVASVSTFLCGPQTPQIPPISHDRIPRDTWWGRMQIRGDWTGLRWRRFVVDKLTPLVQADMRGPGRIHNFAGTYRRLARRAGVSCREGKDYWLGFAGPHMRLPEVLICPRSFDFAAAPDFGRHYVASGVNVSRPEDTRLIDSLEPGKPVVYCSLGSDSHIYPHSAHFFRVVAEASRLRPDWQWVLSVGSRFDAGMFTAGANLAVVNWAPQMALLGRAAVMVTHGGLNSVLECVHLGVPMVIVPGKRDQPGNLARAVSHGVALGARMKGLRAAHLIELMERAMGSQEMRAATARLQQSIAAEDGLPAALAMIESLAGRV